MARHVFFSFHFERDAWRAGQVRNSWIAKPDREVSGFWDSAAWEEVKKRDDKAIKDWIDKQFKGTSVTVVLIGAETSSRAYVKYELEKSWQKGNGILGIYIHRIKDSNKKTDEQGKTTFGPIFTSTSDDKKYFHERFNIYDWVDDDGYENLGEWVEKAARQVGR
jgi:MTH538 TIR-like domain (DUF1863)